MLSRHDPDRIHVAFDAHHLETNAGLNLPVTPARRLGLGELADLHLGLGEAAGRANAGDKLLTLVASALAGGTILTMPTHCAPAGPSRRWGPRSRFHPRWGRSRAASGRATFAIRIGRAVSCWPILGRRPTGRRAVDHRPGLRPPQLDETFGLVKGEPSATTIRHRRTAEAIPVAEWMPPTPAASGG